ncbi:uncharacterized protein LOC142168282 [Nicotiana tabacum]|uniref:Uncharacterized protein LOC142168282 n=1 Tax=Nicotiana tabacum TaxID=4097 RepID=A0AC58SJA3_TOBAC
MISLWENLKEVAQGINIPWLVTGDFNEVMAPQDRMFGNPVTYVETKDYANCIQGLMLNELQWKCDYYTWTNKQSGTDIIYTIVKERAQRKQINELTSMFGTKLTDFQSIKEETVDFYKCLMGSAAKILPTINKHTMRKGPTMSHQKKLDLCTEVTKQEVFKVLNSIEDEKSPGVDGFNSYFFKKSWQVVKGDIVMAVKEFFSIGKMYKAVNLNYTIVINGETTEAFNVARDLRQGDPMSPFLFAMVVEYLSRCLNELKEVKAFKYHPRCTKLGITHLNFADDLLMFTRGDITSVAAVQQCFLHFSTASKFQANMGKSCVYFGGVQHQEKETILAKMGFNQGDLPFKYLGIPLSTKKLNIVQWKPLVDKITARITSWITKKHSYASRVQLVQSVIFGVQSYWAQLFIIPTNILSLIESYYRSFVWSGTNTITRKALVAWERVCSPTSMGGLNLINIKLWNKTTATKTCWDLAHKQDKLWIRWVHTYHIKRQQIQEACIPQQACWIIRKIMEAREDMKLIQNDTAIKKSITSLIYKQLLPNNARVPWKCLMYRNDARPKVKIIM